MAVQYHLRRAAREKAQAPVLDDAQQQVVDHPGGPLLVLAGPGTGKTTTLVEAVVDRVENRGLAPHELLVLTFSRKAAEELRTRITARLGRTSSAMLASTFHAFGYGLVRKWQPRELYADPLRLLSAPEQDVRLRELLTHSRETGKATWPQALEQALRTRGFAREVHAVLSRAREVGLEPEDLSRIGAEHDRPEWVAAGDFMREYLHVLDFENAADYAELMHRAVLLAEADDVRRDLRSQYGAVFVDEYQDTDPSQVRLLQAIAGNGRDLVVVGDPDQSIYAFRGADVRGILEFPSTFPRSDGTAAPVIPLESTRRFGHRLLTASRRIASGIGVSGSIDVDTFRRFREPSVGEPEYGDGRVEVLTFSSSGAETDHIADILRRAHLEDEVPWSQMAVLVRSGVTTIPGLRRALVAAGVPVEVASDEVPLRAEPAVQPLLSGLRAAVDPEHITPDLAHELLLSPLGHLDAAAVRRLGRRLRRADRVAHEGERGPLPSGELLRQGLADPAMLADLDGAEVAQASRLATLIGRAHRILVDGRPAEEALWQLWSGTRWPRRLRAAAERGGAAARSAHRDLDALCALFEVAARSEEKSGHSGAEVFLAEIEAQQIPADTLAERGVQGDSVRLLTAHRSKGLEWRLVVIAGVQEGSWPDVRRRGTLLQADRLGADGLVDPLSAGAMLAEERRLFYVAATRARQRLVVTAVASPEADGDQPSRLLADLGVPVQARPGRPRRPMSLPGLVAELRRVAADPTVRPPLRNAAAARLAGLAAETVDGRPLVAGADPSGWWGMRRRTTNDTPVRPADEPVRISASTLAGILECPLKWFLSHEAGGESARGTPMGFGSVVHVLADHLGRGKVTDRHEMLSLLDSVWDQLAFESRWVAERERGEAEAAIDRLLAWQAADRGRSFVGSERQFLVDVALGEQEQVRLNGRADRLERDAEGHIVVVDFKTSKNPPSQPTVEQDPQLGLYQLAVEGGAFEDVCGPDARSGGAELVQLRADDEGRPKVQPQPRQQPDDSGDRLIETQLRTASGVIRAETFDATLNKHCKFCDFRTMCPAQQRGGGVL